MTLQDTLIGHWSAYAYNGYGSMEDECVVFLPDHTGWYAFDRGFLCECETFTWLISPDNLLSIEGREYAVAGNQRGTFKKRPSDLHIANLPITVREEPVQWPGQAHRLILTFATAPFAGRVKFAQITADSTNSSFPRFAGESGID